MTCDDCEHNDDTVEKRPCGAVLCDDCFAEHLCRDLSVGISGCMTCRCEMERNEFYEYADYCWSNRW